jgi:hypothetical protein
MARLTLSQENKFEKEREERGGRRNEKEQNKEEKERRRTETRFWPRLVLFRGNPTAIPMGRHV